MRMERGSSGGIEYEEGPLKVRRCGYVLLNLIWKSRGAVKLAYRYEYDSYASSVQ